MRQDLEDLWNYYLIEVPIKNNKREKLTIESFSNKEKQFRSKLTPEQIKSLEEYDNAVASVGRITE